MHWPKGLAQRPRVRVGGFGDVRIFGWRELSYLYGAEGVERIENGRPRDLEN